MIILFIVFHDDSFTFKTVSSNCSNFEISGSIAYNKNKSYLYISNIDYCGGTDNNLYKKIECLLYEEHGMVKKQIGNYTYEKDSSIKLNDFLKDVNFTFYKNGHLLIIFSISISNTLSKYLFKNT